MALADSGKEVLALVRYVLSALSAIVNQQFPVSQSVQQRAWAAELKVWRQRALECQQEARLWSRLYRAMAERTDLLREMLMEANLALSALDRETFTTSSTNRGIGPADRIITGSESGDYCRVDHAVGYTIEPTRHTGHRERVQYLCHRGGRVLHVECKIAPHCCCLIA
jgi:hypothetical protein